MKPKPSKRELQIASHGLYGIGDKPKPKQTRKKPVQGEAQLQAQCVKWFNLQYPELYYSLWATPNGGYRNAREGANLSRQGVTAGVSDLILCYKGTTTFIELKTPKGTGKQSDNQKAFEEHITSHGFDYHIVDNFEDFQDLIRGIIASSD